MTEHDILSVYLAASAEQNATIGLLISLHFAIIVGVYYFLHRSGLAMKLAVLALYTLGYALLVGLLYNSRMISIAASNDLHALMQSGANLSNSGYAALEQSAANNWVGLVASSSIAALWIATIAFLFLWKRPKEPT